MTDRTPVTDSSETLPENCLPPWEISDLPEPQPLGLRNWASFIGPGIVMMGIQIGGGEWLFGPLVSAKYGGGLMWIATVAIVLQVFYNLECGRYALYCGEPVMTGFMRKQPGPMAWISVIMLLSLSALIPGLSSHAAAVIAAIHLDRPPTNEDRELVNNLGYLCLLVITLPVLIGGKVYNMLQAVMTLKIAAVLGFCLIIGTLFVDRIHWFNVFSGFFKFGNVPVKINGQDQLNNVFVSLWRTGSWPLIEFGNIAALGAFAGYAGGGGLANSTYSNYVRDKGWGMGKQVGAIASAVGGRDITLSHLGKVFRLTPDNLRRWRGWWRYILTDQLIVWAPGCFVGMALPALLSLQFAKNSALYGDLNKIEFAQAMITADGIRHASEFSPALSHLLWMATLIVGLIVLLPSQMSVVEDFSRRWTDIIWSGSRYARENMRSDQVKYIYYALLFTYVLWTVILQYLFNTYGSPKLMTSIIANFNNLAIGVTAFLLLWVNSTLLPKELRPRWYSRVGMILCGVFYVGLATLVFCKVYPDVVTWWQQTKA